MEVEVMKNYGRTKKRQTIYFFLSLILALSLVSCAASKTYWLRLRADITPQKRATAGLTIGVLPFQDNRPASQRLGQRLLSNGQEEPIRLQSSSLSQDITSILLQLLQARGIRTVELTGWEPVPANLKNLPEGVDVAIAGYLEALEVEAKSTTFKTEIRYLVKLAAKLGFKEQGKVVTRTVEARPEESVISFNRQEVENTLNETLSSALERLIVAAISSAG
jgi:uncharacterized lipoprotein YmbA